MSDAVRIKIRNAMGVARADLDVAPGQVALVAGLNFAGKSSLIQSIGASVTGNGLVRGITTKKGSAALIRDGARAGRVVVETDRGSSQVSWPDAVHETKGIAPAGHPYAVGVAQLAKAADAKTISNTLVDVLKAVPTAADLAAALEPHDVTQQVIERVWSRIEAEGWDATGVELRDRGIGLKQQWADLAGGAWGSKKAEGWIPKDFDDYDEALTLEDYRSVVERCRVALETAIANQAVSQERLDALTKLIEAGAAAEEELKRVPEQIAKLEKELAERVAVLAALPSTDEKWKEKKCPHCGGGLQLVTRNHATVIVASAAEVVSETELKQRRLDFAAADGDVANARDRLNMLLGNRIRLEQTRDDGVKAKTELDQLDGKPGKPVDVDGARARLAQAEANVKAIERMTGAGLIHDKILRNQAILEAVGPAGVRQTKLNERLAGFCRRVNKIARRFDNKQLQYRHPEIEVRSDMSITVGGRPYALLSESEQFRVDVAIQAALAMLTRPPLLLCDRADVLHPQDRPGLLNALRVTGIPCVVAMTAKAPDTLPDLRKAGWGQCWWMEAGRLSPTER